jgi:tRNA threonylcarbamoyladenosine biosynthesis protein TsaB
MLIVAVDTSGRNGSVALCHGDGSEFEVRGLAMLEGGTYSARLVPCIADLLASAKRQKSQIDGLVVVDGPGSFTGLRVGISTAKAICEALRKPLAAVSMLEVLAATYGIEGEVLTTVLDAGRGELYVGEYEILKDDVRLKRQYMPKLTELVSRLPSAQMRIISTFPKVEELCAGAGIASDLVAPIGADRIARIGLRKLMAGELADPATLDANYIRRSDAELFSPPKH